MHDNTHLTIDERKIIQTGIEHRSTKKSISDNIGKDPTTIAKEIRKHRTLKPRNSFNNAINCIHLKQCIGCSSKCDKFKEPSCKWRDRSPGACNNCSKMASCRLDHFFYYATQAHETYLYELQDSREGINLTTLELKALADIIVPLINQGQSPYQILANHPEIKKSEHCIYNYIDMGVFRDYGLINLSLKEKVKRKQFKDKYKKRKEPANYEGHKYIDYLAFKANNPTQFATEMDTVYNSTSGPYIQTFIFPHTSLMIGFLHQSRTSASMSATFNQLQAILTPDEFAKLFSFILTDRGVEFEKIDSFVKAVDGTSRLNIFFCDPMNSNQKPHVENNHNFVRDIIVNELDLSLYNQDDIILTFNHINSTPREMYQDEMFSFLYGEELLHKLNVTKIDKDKVILKPYLLTKKSV